MKKILFLSICLLISFNAIAQTKIEAKELTKKELRALKKQKAFEKQKKRYEKRGLNAWGINENAPNVVMAIREHLGSSALFSTQASFHPLFASSKAYLRVALVNASIKKRSQTGNLKNVCS